MISVLVVAHEPLATALIHCTRHIYGRLPSQVAALDVIPDEDPEIALRAARDLAARINDGSGLVVLTDLFGATPARVAARASLPAGRPWAKLPILRRRELRQPRRAEGAAPAFLAAAAWESIRFAA